MIRRMTLAILLVCVACVNTTNAQELYKKLQDISVTVKASSSEGSGVIITRAVKTEGNETEQINFVWTAAHVVSGLRSVRNIIENGQPKKVIEFKDAQIVQELVENGRRVGELKMDTKVIKYSDATDGEDLALLMVRKRSFIKSNAEFYNGKGKPVSIGAELYHVGSLLGQTGSNSMTRGIVSQVGRVLNLGSGDGTVFDQTTVTAFPGSSGGGVFLSERSGDKAGQYMGMLVRGAGETFNLIVPVRRMRVWATKHDILWAIDMNKEVPDMEEILSLPVEGPKSKSSSDQKSFTPDAIKFPTLIY